MLALLKKYLPQLLLILYLLVFVALSVNPIDRATWWAENIPVFLVVVLLVFTYRKFRFSNLAYFLMATFLIYHTVGGHFTFERVPFDFINDMLVRLDGNFLFVDGRNNFDRLGHFLVGVFAFPAFELFYKKKWVSQKWVAYLLSVALLGLWAAIYEIIEMSYAVYFGGVEAENFLGSQGDVWDAQKDMLLDILGALLFGALGFFAF